MLVARKTPDHFGSNANALALHVRATTAVRRVPARLARIYLTASRVTSSLVARSTNSGLYPSSVSFHRKTLPSFAFL